MAVRRGGLGGYCREKDTQEQPRREVTNDPGWGTAWACEASVRPGSRPQSAPRDPRTEDVISKHGDGVVDEPYVTVAVRIIGELLAGQAGDQCSPHVEVGVIVEPKSGERGAGLGNDVNGKGVGLG